MSPSLHNLRRADANDAGDLAAIRAQCFDAAWPPEDFAKILQDEKNYYCLIVPGIAYALVQKMPPEAELITVAVIPEYRRRGIAEQLLRDARQDLAAEQIHTIHLEVNETLTSAQQLYRKLGFESVGRRAGYYQNSMGISHDAILMRLQTPL